MLVLECSGSGCEYSGSAAAAALMSICYYFQGAWHFAQPVPVAWIPHPSFLSAEQKTGDYL